MDLLQVKCIIHIGYKDDYSLYTNAGVIQSQGDTPAWGRIAEHPRGSKPWNYYNNYLAGEGSIFVSFSFKLS